MSEADRPRMVGINHVALAVGDLDAALEWYGRLFEVDLRGRTPSGAFVDMGDQFVALSETDDAGAHSDAHRHFGLVVDDRDALERRLEAVGVERLDTSGCDFHDPWGNRIQVVEYADVQFTKVEHVLDGMDLSDDAHRKTDSALEELAAKGMAPEDSDRTP